MAARRQRTFVRTPPGQSLHRWEMRFVTSKVGLRTGKVVGEDERHSGRRESARISRSQSGGPLGERRPYPASVCSPPLGARAGGNVWRGNHCPDAIEFRSQRLPEIVFQLSLASVVASSG